MSPQEILLENEQIIDMIHVHHYVPHKNHAHFRQVVAALQMIDPKGKYESSCSGCMMEIARMAKVHLDAYKATMVVDKAVFHTFPAHREDPYHFPDYPAVERKKPEIQSPKKKGGRPKGSKNK